MTMTLPFDLSRRSLRALAQALAALLALLCAVLAVRIVFLLLAGPTLPALAPEGAAPAVREDTPPLPLAGVALFGAAQNLPGYVEAAPETSLRLQLRGTLNDTVPEEGIAIIADGEGRERAYRVGDTLPGGARLEAVYAARVLILHEGRREGLSLSRVQLESGSASGNRPSSAPAAAATSAAPAAPSAYGVGPMAFGVPDLAGFRDPNLPDLDTLAREVRALPVLENGRMVGVRLQVGRDSDLLDRLGVAPGDVLTAVNGVPLDGPERQAELIRSFRAGQPVQLTIRRDGATREVTLRP